jgi:hypothetical protein
MHCLACGSGVDDRGLPRRPRNQHGRVLWTLLSCSTGLVSRHQVPVARGRSMDELRASTERHERDAREQHGDAEETSARVPAAREAQHPVTVDSRSWLLSAYSPEPSFLSPSRSTSPDRCRSGADRRPRDRSGQRPVRLNGLSPRLGGRCCRSPAAAPISLAVAAGLLPDSGSSSGDAGRDARSVEPVC